MKNSSALNWIKRNSAKELPKLVLLSIVDAFYSVCGVSLAVFAKLIIDCAQKGDMNELLKNAVILLAVIILQIALKLGSKALEVRVAGKLEIKYKTELFSNILKKDYLKISLHHSGELMTRLTSDITVVSQAVTTIVPSVVGIVTRLICAFTVLFMLDKWFAVLFLLAGFVLFVFTRLFRNSMKKLHKAVQETDSDVRSFMQESIESILVIKIFNVGQKILRKSEALQQENYKAKVKKNRWSVFANLGFSAMFSFGYLFGLVWSGVKLCTGSISFGTLTAIMQLVGQVQTPFTTLSGVVPQYYAMLASAERIVEIENLSASKSVNPKNIDTKKVYENLQSVEFESVSFGYGKESVIEEGTFSIKKGDFTVISGISGIGKSTLFKLLVGVIPADKGRIFIKCSDGEYQIDKYMRSLFAYVPQGNMLFSGTIRDNIRFVNETASDTEVMQAAKISCADEFINSLPDGLDTVLLENGHGLSEGQIQRLAIARAILTSAPVLLLDEATSALDEETEKKVLSNIRELKDKTCIIISHKSAAYEICDKELKIAERKISVKNLR